MVAAAVALSMTGAAVAQQEDAPERSADPADKMICKRFLETGSLIRGYRVCKTHREWEHERAALRTMSVADSCRNRAEPDPNIPNGGGCGLN